MTRFRIINVAVVLALCALILWKVDLREVGHSLRAVDPALIAAVVLLNVPVALLYAVRSDVVLRRMGYRVPQDVLLATMVLGNVAGSLTPAASGEVVRVAALRAASGVQTDEAVSLVIYERGVSTYMMALGAGVAGAAIALPPVAAAGIACIGLLLLLAPVAATRFFGLLPAADVENEERRIVIRLLSRLRTIASQLRGLLADLRLFLAWCAITAVLFALVTFQFWLLARSVSDAIDPLEAWLALSASQLAAIVSLLPLGIGAADSSLTGLMRRFGVTLEQGTVIALLVRATVTLPLGLAAVASHIYLARRSSEVAPAPVRPALQNGK